MTTLIKVAGVVATVLTGLSAGFFYTYADSVTRGLGRTDDATYVLAFQMINEEVRTPLFLLVFAGPAVALLLATLVSARRGVPAVLFALAFLAYAGGVVLVTMTGNVPLNDDLADLTGLDVAGYAAARLDFEDRWNELNLVRAIAAFAAFVAATMALALLPGRTRAPQSVEP